MNAQIDVEGPSKVVSTAQRLRTWVKQLTGPKGHTRSLVVRARVTRQYARMRVAEPEPPEKISGVGVALRPTGESDLGLLTEWFTRPDFNRYWGNRAMPIDEVAAKYIGRRRPLVECFIVEVADTPVGWIQYHVDGKQRGGIDMVLLQEHRGRGVGRAAANAIVGYLLDSLRWSEVTVDPSQWNTDGSRFWAAIGFAPVEFVDSDPDREPYTLMRWIRA